ncbi:uncharacterized protein LOC117783671 [Drosophila innubila]|uniref:uncharacterized protein LOC117783671 n=1 Tax=Drosophila innubila TaxID=198719 RepID=UPI00148D00F5|nr:uncharacterized protein LOC117783671 [Drosophila innubila]
MSVVKGLRRCIRVWRQRVASKLLESQFGALSVEQRRNYRYDDRFNWPTGSPGDRKVYTEEGFDPRYDERHYKSYQRTEGFGNNTSAKDSESRRRITQDTADHQRRQERIIQENKWRWQYRSEPKTTGLRYSFEKPIYGAGPPSKKGGTTTEPRRRGQEQRQKEVKRQERELRESRKNYDLPGYNRPLKSEADEAPVAEDTPSPAKTASQAWLEKRAREDEQKYWHSWHTCPSERQNPESAEDASEEIMHGYEGPRGPRRGLVKPPQPYDGGVRRFQTHSVQLADRKVAPPRFRPGKKTALRRKPNGMEKQYRLARDFTRVNRLSDESDVTTEEFSKFFKRPSSSLLQSHVLRSPPTFGHIQEEERLEDIELPKQPPRMKLAWKGLPRPVYKRFDSIKRAVARNNQDRLKQRLEPPRFRMTVKSKGLMRQRTPIDSFSNQLAVNTRFTPYSEYLGYGRQTVCDAWHSFANVHNLKPIY